NHTTTTPLEDMAAARAVNGNNQCLKVFVQRDYSEGTLVKFQTRFPTELEERPEDRGFESRWIRIFKLNQTFRRQHRNKYSAYIKCGFMACLTAYLIYICTETHYEKNIHLKVSREISPHNSVIFKHGTAVSRGIPLGNFENEVPCLKITELSKQINNKTCSSYHCCTVLSKSSF
ncbi:hypothetical protein L9F63_025331, partial [Diploptera punctata]